MKKISAACTAVATIVMLLGGCANEQELRFCERENRTIPDAELKGRLLFQLYKYPSSWGKLPSYMHVYIARNLSEDASDEKVQVILTEYANKNPLCCQFTPRSDNIDRMYEGKIPYKYDKISFGDTCNNIEIVFFVQSFFK